MCHHSVFTGWVFFFQLYPCRNKLTSTPIYRLKIPWLWKKRQSALVAEKRTSIPKMADKGPAPDIFCVPNGGDLFSLCRNVGLPVFYYPDVLLLRPVVTVCGNGRLFNVWTGLNMIFSVIILQIMCINIMFNSGCWKQEESYCQSYVH